MISLALVFHLASAVALLTLGWFLLRFRQDRDFLRRLLRIQSGQESFRIVVADPVPWLAAVARALGVEFSKTGPRGKLSLVRIDAATVFDLLLPRLPSRMAVTVDSLLLETNAPWTGAELSRLAAALGGLHVKTQALQGSEQGESK